MAEGGQVGAGFYTSSVQRLLIVFYSEEFLNMETMK